MNLRKLACSAYCVYSIHDSPTRRRKFLTCADSVNIRLHSLLCIETCWRTAQNIIEVGKRLIQAKSLVQHGQWQTWLQNNFQLSHASARKFMECAERFSKMGIDSHFGTTQMIQLLSLPDAEETEKFLAQKAAEGKKVYQNRPSMGDLQPQ